MDEIKFYGCYSYDEEWLLIELMLDEYSDKVDFSTFEVADYDIPKKEWQREPEPIQFLNVEGTERACEIGEMPPEPMKPCRFVFFVSKPKDKHAELYSKYLDLPLDSQGPVPQRLRKCLKFADGK